MKPLHVLGCSILLANLVVGVAEARKPAPARAVQAASPAAAGGEREVLDALERGFLAAWTRQQSQRSRFSRMASPPSETRARLGATQTDARGARFHAFAVDSREAFDDGAWSPSVMTGCIYPEGGKVYLKRGDGYRAAEAFLGKKAAKAPAHVCAPVQAAARGNAAAPGEAG